MLKSKWIFVSLLLCVLLPLAANATITRVIGLGGANANYIIKDAANPQIWPQLIADWPNLAGAEFYNSSSVWDFQKAYLNYSCGESGSVFQIAIDKLPGINSMFFGGSPYTLLPTVTDTTGTGGNTPASKLSVTWGMPLNGMKIGAALNIAEHSYKNKATPADEDKATLIGINLGGSFLDNKLDAAVGFESVSGSMKPGASGSGEDKTDGSMALNVSARYWWMYADKMALVPNIRFQTQKDAVKFDGGDKDGYTTTDIKVGIGHNWTPVENTLAIFELGVDVQNVKDESTTSGVTTTIKTTVNSMPYWRIGFETKVFDWLNGRLGAERNWVNETNDAKPLEPEAAFSQTSTFVGATAHWNRLIFDLLIEPNFFEQGPNFISGYNNNLFTRVSLKYDFNK